MINKKYVGKVISHQGSYGFIRTEELVDNVFFHCTDCIPEEQLRWGDIVEYELGTGKDGRQKAIHVHLIKSAEDVRVQ